MVFSMNVFKNKNVGKIKNVKKRKKRALNKKRKKRFLHLWENGDFRRRKSPFISETVRDRPMVTMER